MLFFFSVGILEAEEVQNFEDLTDYYSCGLRRISHEGLVGFENKKGKVVISPQFNYAYPFLKKKCLALKNAELTEVSSTDSGESEFSWSGGTWGVIDVKGNVVKPFLYQRRWSPLQGEFIYVSQQDSFYVNGKGKIVEL